jgi:hypothetical protein
LEKNKQKIDHDLFLIPSILFGVCIAAYGLQILWLGYYLDDWIILRSYTSGGIHGLMEYSFLGNRPLVFWIWGLGFRLLGLNPLNWQIWALFWRYLTVLIFWFLLRVYWPEHTRRTALAACIFAVYPIFYQQSSALTYSFHWFCFFMTLLSFYLMILSYRKKNKWFVFTFGSLLTGMISLFSQEFFIGLELIRPILLWFELADQYISRRDRTRQTFRAWGPYLLMLIGYLIWRLFLMPTPGMDRNAPIILTNLFSSPLKTIPILLAMVFKDLVNGVIGGWYRTFQPELFTTSPISNLVAWVLVGLVFICLFVAFRLWEKTDNNSKGNDNFLPWAILIGLLALLLGFAPGWSIGRSISDPGGSYNDRFGLAAMAGASLLIVGLFEWLLKSQRIRTAFLFMMVALALGQQFRSETTYRWSWEKQKRMVWQLKWRAPQLASPTAIYGDGALIKYMGSWANTSLINEMYAIFDKSEFQPYWYVDLYKTNITNIIEKKANLNEKRVNLKYMGNSEQNLVIQANSLPVQCLWVVDFNDRYNPYLIPEVKNALSISNKDRILDLTDNLLDSELFGTEIPRDWCYYFEKADLARQIGDWKKVMGLWKEAISKGYSPSNSPEYIPFIEASAYLGEWSQAIELSRDANFPSYVMHDYLCTTWAKIDKTTNNSNGKFAAIEEVKSEFYCDQFFR